MAQEDKNSAIFEAYDETLVFDPAAPEKNLLKAVLMSALADLRRNGEPHRKATEFFLSSEDDYLFSFRSICAYLDVDPKRILTVTGLDPNAELDQSTEPVQHHE